MDDQSLKVTDAEIAAWFSDPIWASRFGPILRLNEAAELLRVPPNTMRDWRSRGLLDGCCRRSGKQVLFVRDRLIKRVLNEGLRNEK
jgi:Helix-turn-helix domain